MMPGDENNPNLQLAGASTGTGENTIPPVPGLQQTGEVVPDPTLRAVVNLQTVYNPNGGSPVERENVRNGADNEQRIQNGGSRRSSGQNPQNPPAPPPNPVQSDPPIADMALKERKFSVLDRLEPTGIEEEDRYVPDQNKVLFSNMKWNFDGQDSFEDYVVRIGGYALTLGVGEI